MNNQILVNNIRQLCKENHKTISQLEKDLYMSPGLISRWTKNMPTLDRIMEIANYFGISLDDLIGDANNTSTDYITNQLLSVLYAKSIHAELNWDVFDKSNPIACMNTDPFLAQNVDTFYCSVNDGYFLLTAKYAGPDHTRELFLYVVANDHSNPSLYCSDTMKLMSLYEYLFKRCSERLDKINTANFINEFLSSANESIPNDKANTTILYNFTKSIVNE